MEIIGGLRANTTAGTTRKVLALLDSPSRGSDAGTRCVLDAPAGTGALAQLLKQRGHSVVALEIQPDLFEAKGVSLMLADLESPLPLRDGSFDAAVCMDGIEHLENPYLTVRELARVLRPGGRLVLSTPNISAFRSRARFAFTGFHNKGKTPLQEERPSPLHHINLITFPELRYALHRCGLRLESIATNRVKIAAWPFALLYPFAAIATLVALRHEKDPRQRELNREIVRQMLSWNVAMGETLVVSATKTAGRVATDQPRRERPRTER